MKNLNEKMVNGVYLATDADFEVTELGNFRYIGDAKCLEIPHVIKGVEVTSYYGMFKRTYVEEVISTNPNIINMEHMFGNSKATSLDLSGLDTSNVTNMHCMFSGSQATSIDLSNFNTSKVTDMSNMFKNSKATSLDLSSLDTSNVTDMSEMFRNSKATTLDLSSFDTSKVTDMAWMFYESQATSIDLSSFNASNVLDMDSMFKDSQVTSLDFSNFDASKVTSMSSMFENSKLTSIDLSNFKLDFRVGVTNIFRNINVIVKVKNQENLEHLKKCKGESGRIQIIVKEIYLTWRNKNKNYVVGTLVKDCIYKFYYSHDILDAMKEGFKPLIDFPDINTEYWSWSDKLFPTFACRLPDKKSIDMPKILKKYKMKEYDEFVMLKNSGAKLPIDSLEFVKEP